MGVRILLDTHERQAVLYDSVTGWALAGPLFSETHHDDAHLAAECFLEWLGTVDPRSLSTPDLYQKYAVWLLIRDRDQDKDADADEDAPCPMCDPDVDHTDTQ